jgi:hypothetical protein
MEEMSKKKLNFGQYSRSPGVNLKPCSLQYKLAVLTKFTISLIEEGAGVAQAV